MPRRRLRRDLPVEELLGALGGAHARVVAVEEVDDALGEPREQLHVLLGERGAERGDGVRQPRHVQRDDVRVALDDDRGARPHDLVLRPVDRVQVRSTCGTAASRRVLRYFGWPSPSTRPPNAIVRPGQVGDREHHAAEEAVAQRRGRRCVARPAVTSSSAREALALAGASASGAPCADGA